MHSLKVLLNDLEFTPQFVNTLLCGMSSVYTSNLSFNKLSGLVGSTILFIIYYK